MLTLIFLLFSVEKRKRRGKTGMEMGRQRE